MAFDLTTWKTQASNKLRQLGEWLHRRKNKDAPYLVYGALCSMSLWPLIEAAQAGQLLPAMLALGGVAGGVGGNLIANQIQRWADQADPVDEAEVEEWIAENSSHNPDLQQALDAILQELDAISQARATLATDTQAWFDQRLGQELSQLGNLARFEAHLSGTGAIAQGKKARAVYAKDGIAIAGDVKGDFIAHLHDQVEFDPEEARLAKLQQRYLEQFAHACNVLPLGVLGGDPETEAEIRLDDVYIELDTTTRLPATEAEKAGRAPGQEERPLSAMAAAIQEEKLVLVGDPGSGKSTFVRQLAGRLALAYLGQRDLPAGWPEQVWPMLTTLRELHPRLAKLGLDNLAQTEQDAQLVEAVCQQWQADLRDLRVADLAERLEDVLAVEKLLVIFDGLDEVPEVMRCWVRRAVRAVLQAYPNIARVIVTCRVRSYTDRAVLSGFAKHELASFDDDKIKQFVHCWYHAQVDRLGQSQAEQKAQDLQQAVLDPNLRKLAQNPMLLTTMAIIHQQEVGLPRERVRLYNLAVQVLLNKWQKSKGLSVSDRLQAVLNDDLKLRAMLQHLAYEIHQRQAAGDQAAELPRGEIVTMLEASKYLGDIGLAGAFLDYADQRTGLLVGRGGVEGQKPQTYDFPHRTFQEYLAGCQMVTGRSTTINPEYKRRVAEGDYWTLAGQLGAEELFYNRKSPETLLDLAYSLCPVRDPAEDKQWRAVLWSGQMAVILGRQTIMADVESDDHGPRYWQRLIPRLVQILNDNLLTPLERAEAGRVLAYLGDPRPGVGLRPDGVPDIVWCEVPVGPFVMGSQEDWRKEEIERLIYGKEMPQHTLDLPAFRISRFLVTNAQYRIFIETGGYQEASYWPEAVKASYWREGQVKRRFVKGGEIVEEWATAPADYGQPFDLANHPVVGINWYEAMAYCHWLTEKLRQAGELRPDEIITLPSEAQWEKAARGTDGRIYPWGDEPDPNRANYDDTGIGATSAVGCFPDGASPYGCLDMSGNVWEWCSTKWQTDYQDYKDDNDLEGEAARVLRGGSFSDSNQDVRCAFRVGFSPDYWCNGRGFRVVGGVVSPSTSGL